MSSKCPLKLVWAFTTKAVESSLKSGKRNSARIKVSSLNSLLATKLPFVASYLLQEVRRTTRLSQMLSINQAAPQLGQSVYLKQLLSSAPIKTEGTSVNSHSVPGYGRTSAGKAMPLQSCPTALTSSDRAG